MNESEGKLKTCVATNVFYSQKCADLDTLASTFVGKQEDLPVITGTVGIPKTDHL